MMSISVKPKKRGRPATGKDPLVGVRMPPELTQKLDEWSAGERPPLSRSEAIRYIVRDWLIGHGLIEPEPEPDEGG